MRQLNADLIQECKKRLIEKKGELLNYAKTSTSEFRQHERLAGGDEADQSVNILSEHSFVIQQERVRLQLLEIESALGRIELGTYGLCEETEEPIEIDRLLALPWTRLSIEGAEVREEMDKRFAK